MTRSGGAKMKILGEALLTVAGEEGRVGTRVDARLHSFRPLIRRTHFVSARFSTAFFPLFFSFFPIVESVIPLTGNCLGRQMFRPNARRWDYRGSFCCAAYIYWAGVCFLPHFLYPSLSLLFSFFSRLSAFERFARDERGDFSIVSINFFPLFSVYFLG